MVVIHLKINDRNQFLYEVSIKESIDKVIEDLVLINNLRTKIDLTAVSIEELLKHGPLKPEESRGLSVTEKFGDEIDDKYKPKKEPMPDRVGNVFNEDKSHHRTGWTFEKDVVEKYLKEIADLKEKISIKQIEKKNTMKIADLFEIMDMLRAIVYINYPGYVGLPNWEPCINYLEGNIKSNKNLNINLSKDNVDDTKLLQKEDLLNIESSLGEFFKIKDVTLWCGGKEYLRGKCLKDYLGKNDKTKIICKFSNKSSGAPVREPLIDSETQKKMMQIYFKKQQEIKDLENNNEDDYLNSQWADPSNLKKSLYTGNKDINWKIK